MNTTIWSYHLKLHSNKATWQELEITIQRGPKRKFSRRLFLSPFNDVSQFQMDCGHIERQWLKYLPTLETRRHEWTYTWSTVNWTSNDWTFYRQPATWSVICPDLLNTGTVMSWIAILFSVNSLKPHNMQLETDWNINNLLFFHNNIFEWTLLISIYLIWIIPGKHETS